MFCPIGWREREISFLYGLGAPSGKDAKPAFIIGLGCGHLNVSWVITSDITLTLILFYYWFGALTDIANLVKCLELHSNNSNRKTVFH